MTPRGPELTCHVLDTGHCKALEMHLLRGGRRRTVICPSLVALLGHPTRGWLLWDSGYAPRLWDATRRFPFRMYRWVTPLDLRPELAVVGQLPRLGLKPDDIRRVVISHFHADHVSGLLDFPKAELFASQVAYEYVRGCTGFRALNRAFVPALLPDDFERRAVLLSAFDGTTIDPFGASCDLFGDGSALLMPLPGHARGQLGLLANTTRGPIFFVADSCWLSAGYRENRPPHWITHAIIDDATVMRDTLSRLHTFSKAHPEIAVVPSHCSEALARFVDPLP